MIAKGKWYDGKTSRQHDVELSLKDRILEVTGEGIALEVPVERVGIDPRLGKAMRAVRFPGGEVLETTDQDFLEMLERRQGRGSFFRSVYRWENSLGRVFVAFLLVLGVAFAFVRFGIPALADRAAFAFPAATEAHLGRETLQILDRAVLKPTKLRLERRRELQRLFATMTAPYPQRKGWRLEFRSGDIIGANAFALPSGIVIVTDRLIEIAKTDDEVAGVLAHEIGHLTRRHALRHLLRNSATALLVATLTGDLTSVTSLAGTLPTTLIDAKYSREFESEADDAAIAYLKERKVPVQIYAGILNRLEKDQRKEAKKELRSGELFRDHPLAEERVRRVLAQ